MDAIVFDWDGTLVDTLPAITRANAEVLESYGLAFDPDAYRAAYSPDWQEMYVRLGIERSLMAEAGARWLVAYGREMDGVRPMPARRRPSSGLPAPAWRWASSPPATGRSSRNSSS